LLLDEDFRRGAGWIRRFDDFNDRDLDQQFNLLCRLKSLEAGSMSMQNLRHGLFSWV
jgi:hypothetical protein